MVFCSKCGAENDEDSQYCENCDKDLKMEVSEEYQKAAIEHYKEEEKKTKTGRWGRNVLAILMVLVFILFFAAVIGSTSHH